MSSSFPYDSTPLSTVVNLARVAVAQYSLRGASFDESPAVYGFAQAEAIGFCADSGFGGLDVSLGGSLAVLPRALGAALAL